MVDINSKKSNKISVVDEGKLARAGLLHVASDAFFDDLGLGYTKLVLVNQVDNFFRLGSLFSVRVCY